MEKNNILLVHNYYQLRGGEDFVFENERDMLLEMKYNVIEYTRSNNEIKKFSFIKKILLPFTTIFSIKTYKDIKKIIKDNDIDIVHVHNTLNLISPAIFYAAKKSRVPVVQTIHNFRLLCPNGLFYRDNHICEECPNKGLNKAIKHKCYRNSKLQTIINSFMLKVHRISGIYKYCNYIFLTEFNKNKFSYYNKKLKVFDENKFFIKPNFVNNHNNVKVSSVNDRIFNQVIYVGRLETSKGIEKVLYEWKNITDYNLIICGTGPLSNKIENIIKEDNITNVEYKGFLDNNTVKKMIGESIALIMPTQCYEGFPMTIIEALSVGTPIICTDIGNCSSIIKDGTNGYKLKEITSESIMESLSKISLDNEIYSKTYDDYKNKYTLDNNKMILKDIYEVIINENDKKK